MNSTLSLIRGILDKEAEAIRNIPLTPAIEKAVELIAHCKGKVFTTGLGKAGYVAQKAASTFCTTGTPSVFLHPSDSSHGDVGAVSQGDILIAISNSGKTREILETVMLSRKLHISAIIAITSTLDTPLAREAEVALEIGIIEEPCPLGLTPSASVAAMSALLDSLALAAMSFVTMVAT
jgi:arabinose-5-phosphate isomerase